MITRQCEPLVLPVVRVRRDPGDVELCAAARRGPGAFQRALVLQHPGQRLVGHLTVQAFRTSDTISFIEINPRYGGAANLGIAAGAPTPEYAIRAARGERLEPTLGDYEVGLVMLRYSDDLFVRERDLLGGG